MAKPGDRILVTIGRDRRPFSCHVCGGSVFEGFALDFSKIASFRSSLTMPGRGISVCCVGCRYMHMFLEGLLQVWPVADGYPAPPGGTAASSQATDNARGTDPGTANPG
jgi:hypothetical protein